MATAGNRGECGIGADRGAQTSAEVGELCVRGPSEHQHRHLELMEFRPQRSLGTGATGSQASGQTLGTVRTALRSVSTLLIESSEEWLAQPFVHELVNADRFDPIGEKLVGCSSVGALLRVLKASSGSDQDQALNEIRSRQREVERSTSAHGIAEVGATPAGFAAESCALIEIGGHIA